MPAFPASSNHFGCRSASPTYLNSSLRPADPLLALRSHIHRLYSAIHFVPLFPLKPLYPASCADNSAITLPTSRPGTGPILIPHPSSVLRQPLAPLTSARPKRRLPASAALVKSINQTRSRQIVYSSGTPCA
jgi:hypothetical protein